MDNRLLEKPMNNVAKPNQITPEIEEKMRKIANLIIDRVFEDKINNTLKFVPKKRVIPNENTT